MSKMTSKKAVCLMLTAAMLCAASAATASAEEVNVSADNLSVSDSSINASISYDTAAADGYVMASVYDESGRFKDVTFKKVTEGKTLDITMSPTDTVKASVWNLKQAKLPPGENIYLDNIKITPQSSQ